jgi:putative nucleotidyltransferase with HDIG domain
MKMFEKIHNFNTLSNKFEWLFRNSFRRWILIVIVSRYLDNSFASVSASRFKLNQPAPEDFYVTRDIYYDNEKATEDRKNEKAKAVLPVFRFDESVSQESLKEFDLFVTVFTKDSRSSMTPERIVNELRLNIPSIKEYVGRDEVNALMNIASGSEIIFSSARSLISLVMSEGICANIDELKTDNPDLFAQGKLLIQRDESNREERLVPKTLTSGNIRDWIDGKTKTIPLNDVGKSLVILFVRAFSRENCFFDKEQTDANIRKAREEVLPSVEHLIKGNAIVEKGKIVTEEIIEKIQAHEKSDISLSINNFASTFLILLVLFTCTFFLFYKPVFGEHLKKNHILLLYGIAFVYLVFVIVFSKFWSAPEWLPFSVLLPTSTIAVLVSVIIATNIGIVFTLVISVMLLFITQMNVYAFLFAFLSGVAGCLVAMRTEKRIYLVVDGLFLAMYNAFLIFFFGLLKNENMSAHIPEITYGALNGFFCGIFSLGFLPILEVTLNLATKFRLLELSDINAPILKKLLTVAPGTYNHSMTMANLAETACTEIGANYLLARVASYYHDIGKIDSPMYFIENQKSQNVHDELKPTLSVSVIKSHVKVGIEKAKELNLPKEVIDIIAQHHGKSLMKYFYQRAVDENNAVKISPDDFKYPGEMPKSKEAGVVMLADVVEAASRTLKRPTIGKLEKLIWKIIMEKFTGGELNECNLTLTDLEIIKKSFLQILAGHFHSRIEYPLVKENVT